MFKFLVLFSLAILSGCVAAPQKPIPLADNYLQSGEKKVGVVLTKVPKPNTYFPGAGCLLCMAAAEMTNSSLTTHIETLKSKEFKLVETELVQQLKKKGVNVIAIEKNIDLESLPEFSSDKEGSPIHDYREYKDSYGITHLLVIDVAKIGMNRKYSSYVPTEDPKAVVAGVSYMVDLGNNSYSWYKHIEVYKSAKGNWDEPPDFPALTNAYYQAIETGRAMIINEF